MELQGNISFKPEPLTPTIKGKIDYVPVAVENLDQSEPKILFSPTVHDIMATNAKKVVKSAVSSDKKSRRSEDTPSADPLKYESLLELDQQPLEKLVSDEKGPQEGTDGEIQIRKEPSPEPEYEEAILTKIIVER